MAAVISAALLLLVSWLLTWAILMAGNLALPAAVDRLKTWWRRYERIRQHRRPGAGIDREASASVQRIAMAFAVAEQLLREEVDTSRKRRS